MRRRIDPLDALIFCALVVAAGAFVIAVRSRTSWDQDIWWHVRTGQWIAEHGQMPANDPFSEYGKDKPLVAYSWLFDWITFRVHHALGLKGLVLLPAALGALIAAALYHLMRALGASVLTASIVTALGYYALMPLTTPRPWLFSTLFVLVEIGVFVAVWTRPSSGARWLWLLPLLFALWANMHIQFVVGLVVLAMAVADAIWYEYVDPPSTSLTAGPSTMAWVGISAACLAATLVTPHQIRLWSVARDLMSMPLQWTYIGDFLAPDYRHDPDWVRLALTLTAAACIGWQARRQPVRVFFLLLFAAGVYLGFKSRRDTWLTEIAAASVIALARPSRDRPESAVPNVPIWIGAAVAVALTTLVCAAGGATMTESVLRAHVAQSYPDKAAEFIEQHSAPGPIYNYFDWGGFLMWRLPDYRVHMDGRVLVHGEPRILRHIETWQGRPGWETDSELAAATIVVGPRDSALVSLLRMDERFRLLYEDRDGPAVVFGAR